MYACHLNTPIDFWEGWTEIQRKPCAYANCEEYDFSDVPNAVTSKVFLLMKHFSITGNDGYEPWIYYTAIPNTDACPEFAVAIKVEHGGNTWLIADRKIPWITTCMDGWQKI